MQETWELISAWLELGGDSDQRLLPMMARAAIVYLVTLVMVRLGDKRFLGKSSAFDVIIGIMLGSVVSRAINGGAAVLPSLASGAVLVALHWLLAAAAFRSDWFGYAVKGRPRLLVKDGQIDWRAMAASHVGQHDLEGALRSHAGDDRVEHVARAYLERSGDISVLPKYQDPRVVEVKVEAGVQVVRIELA